MIDLRNCVFGFKCTANWDEMKRTSEKTVRHCEQCEKNVYFITKPEELIEAINFNRCVAIAPPESQKDIYYPRPTLGVPKSTRDGFNDSLLEGSDAPDFFVGKVDRTK